MSFSKQTRRRVYDKYGGHCAYCGIELEYRDMQIDHFVPLANQYYLGIDRAKLDDISNLMPSCRMCNHYKRSNSLRLFRRYIEEIPRKCREDYIYKVGVRYGLIEEHPKPVKFFFEKWEDNDEDLQDL